MIHFKLYFLYAKLQVSALHDEKTKIGDTLKDTRTKLHHSETKLHDLRQEADEMRKSIKKLRPLVGRVERLEVCTTMDALLTIPYRSSKICTKINVLLCMLATRLLGGRSGHIV